LRDSADVVEAEGIRRAHEQMRRADRVLFVIDLTADPDARAYAQERERLPRDVPVTLVLNKSDLSSGIPLADTLTGPPRIAISALTGAGLDRLRDHLKDCVGFKSVDTGSVSARRRHLEALRRARGHVEAAEHRLRESRSGELVAEELRGAQQALSEITGEFTSEDLLGRIFGSFCIGK
jgi:tRNA modification GTPase